MAGRVVSLLKPLAGVAALAGTGLVGEQLWRDARWRIGLVARQVRRALCCSRGFDFPLRRGRRAVAERDGLVGWWAAWMGLRSGGNGSWTLVHHGCDCNKRLGIRRVGCSPCALDGECGCCSSAGRGGIAKLAEERERRVSTFSVGEVEAMMSIHAGVDARFDALDFDDAKKWPGDRGYLGERGSMWRSRG